MFVLLEYILAVPIHWNNAEIQALEKAGKKQLFELQQLVTSSELHKSSCDFIG